MTNFNRKVEQASARVGQTVAETTERLEQESAEFIKYLNDEVVPAVRQQMLTTGLQRLMQDEAGDRSPRPLPNQRDWLG